MMIVRTELSSHKRMLGAMRAIEIPFPDGGFILYPVDQLVNETPCENILAIIEVQKARWSYPVL